MAEIYGTPVRGLYSVPWMPGGCELCYPGLKAVVFVTGLCDDMCFYCPVNRERLGKDVFRVNERDVSSVYEVVEEVERTGAKGASITGGDPLLRLGRTVEVIRTLKDVFGPGFHIHLYTSGRYAGRGVLRKLLEAGLDEIRFHPTAPRFIDSAALAKKLGSWSVGFEIPVAPAFKKWAWDVVVAAEQIGLDFVNLNELEVTQDNAEELVARGMKIDQRKPVVAGSLHAGMEIVKKAREKGFRVNVHFCPASFKDSIQTRNRFLHTARRDRRPFEMVSRQGTVMYGFLVGGEDVEAVLEMLGVCYEKMEDGYATLPDANLLYSVAREAGATALIVESHPTLDRRPVIEETVVYDPGANTLT